VGKQNRRAVQVQQQRQIGSKPRCVREHRVVEIAKRVHAPDRITAQDVPNGVLIAQRRHQARPFQYTREIRTLAEKLRSALARPLPGLDVQLRMSPQPRMAWDPERMGVRDGAALLMVYPHRDEPHVVLTERGADLRHHTGQISLPGGRVDPGESIADAALRETEEEIGVPRSVIDVVGALTPLQIPVSGFVLHAVVGVAVARPVFHPAEREVARILEVPLSRFADQGIVKREVRTRTRDGMSVQVDTPYFDLDGAKVWGATAMVLTEFLAVMRQSAD
jgi:8-oxo-dGTP pyrophosphatase MutT (NUDIX family)